jgi:hypothetical protein
VDVTRQAEGIGGADKELDVSVAGDRAVIERVVLVVVAEEIYGAISQTRPVGCSRATVEFVMS